MVAKNAHPVAVAAVKVAMDDDPHFWERRPLGAYAMACAGQEVASLLQLAQRQQAELQSHASQLVVLLSLASSQAKWAEADRTVRCCRCKLAMLRSI